MLPCLPACHSTCLPARLPKYLSICLCQPVVLTIRPSVSRSVTLYACLSTFYVSLSVCLPVHLSVCPSIYLYAYMSVWPSVDLPICLFVHPSTNLPIHTATPPTIVPSHQCTVPPSIPVTIYKWYCKRPIYLPVDQSNDDGGCGLWQPAQQPNLASTVPNWCLVVGRSERSVEQLQRVHAKFTHLLEQFAAYNQTQPSSTIWPKCS